jgi:ADP-heptose:LPS heptosyltransferase
MEDYRNILVIKSGALGDLIAGTTALRALRNAYPNASMSVLSNRLMNDVCPAGILVNEIITSDNGNLSIVDHLNIARVLRKRKYDLAVNLRWTSEGSALLTRLCGAKTRVGSGPKQSRWLYTIQAPWYERRRHEFLRHLDIVEALGITVGTPEPFLYIPEKDHQFAETFYRTMTSERQPVLLLHPGASTASKAWKPEFYRKLAKTFIDKFHAFVVATWGPGEDVLAKSVVSELGAHALLAPATTIGQLGAIIQRATLCVCNYSGVMNVGMAVKTPLVALGCTSPEDWGPYGELHRTVNSYSGHDSYTEEERLTAMNSIPFDQVWSTVESRWRELVAEHSVMHA